MYVLSGVELEAMREFLKTNLANGFIRPSQSKAAAPVMLVKKPDGKLRLVVDFRGLNAVTVKNRFPLPLIGEMLDRLHKAKVFTKIDLWNAYHQVRVREGDEWRTTFKCREGHYEFRVCPMGVRTTLVCAPNSRVAPDTLARFASLSSYFVSRLFLVISFRVSF